MKLSDYTSDDLINELLSRGTNTSGVQNIESYRKRIKELLYLSYGRQQTIEDCEKQELFEDLSAKYSYAQLCNVIKNCLP